MNRTDAMNRLEMYCSPDHEPQLDPVDLYTILESVARTADRDGRSPSDENWEPTYSVLGVYRAAVEAWTVKAGRAAERFDFTTDGQTFRRSQVVDHCEAQAAMYRRKTNGAAPC